MNDFFESYFHIPYRERRGFILLSIIGLLAMPAVYYIPLCLPAKAPDISIIKLSSVKDNKLQTPAKHEQESVHHALFNPNHASQQAMEACGMPGFLAERIIRFRSKGGRFRQKEDLKKVFGMTEPLYARLQGKIVLEQEPGYLKDKPLQSTRKLLDLNRADSADLEALPMIGAGRARLIIKYRSALGGFVSLSQLKEVWGINDSVYTAIKPLLFIDSHFEPQQLLPDSTHARDLFRHPYLRPYARPLLAYYKQHHSVPDSANFCRLFLVQDSTYNKLKIYLKP